VRVRLAVLLLRLAVRLDDESYPLACRVLDLAVGILVGSAARARRSASLASSTTSRYPSPRSSRDSSPAAARDPFAPATSDGWVQTGPKGSNE
jgi:hypothetical protein